MYRLTIMYNLQPDADEEEFLEWRLGEHQASNVSMPGVIHTDFTQMDSGFPFGTQPPYRYMTTSDWPDRETFDATFNNPKQLEALRESLKRIGDYVFLFGEVLVEEKPKA